MNRLLYKAVLHAGSIALLLAFNQSATAQGGRGLRLFGAIPAVTLAQLEEVQQELELTEEQNQKVEQLNEEMGSALREAFQGAAGDRDKMRENIAKVYDEFSTKFNAALEEPQQKRAREIYVQVNGPVALTNEEIAKELMLSDEQEEKLEQAVQASRTEVFQSFQEFRNMSEEERAKKFQELIESRDESLLAVLNDQQKKRFEGMKGEKIEVNLENLPRPGGR